MIPNYGEIRWDPEKVQFSEKLWEKPPAPDRPMVKSVPAFELPLPAVRPTIAARRL